MKATAMGAVITLTVAVFVGALAPLHAAAAENAAVSDETVAKLLQIAPEYEGYVAGTVSLPVEVDSVALKVIGQPQRFAKFIDGSVGSVPLTPEEQKQAKALLEKQVGALVSGYCTVKDDAPWQVVIACGEGGGIVFEHSGPVAFLSAELFLLDTPGRKVVFYSDEAMGTGSEVALAIKNLVPKLGAEVVKCLRPGGAATSPAAAPTTAPVTTGPTDVLEAIPTNAWGFVIVRDMQALSNDAVLLGQKLGLPVPPVLPMAKALIGLMEGVNDTGSLALVVGGGGIGMPPMGLLVPVTDMGQMIGYLAPQDAGDGVQQIALMGKPTFVVPYGGFAVMAPSKEAAKMLATASAGVRGKLDEVRLGVYQESDLFAHVELAEVLKTYRPMVEMMIQSMAPAPTTQPESGAPAAPPNPLKAVFDAVLQLNTVDVAANLDAAGLMIQGFLSFLPGTDLAAQSAGQEMTDKPLLVGLPAMGEQYIVAVGSLQNQGEAARGQMVKTLDNLLANPAVAQHIDPAQGEKLKDVVVAFARQVRQGSLSISALPAAADGLIGFTWVLQVDDAAKTAGLIGEAVEMVKLLPKDEAVREDLKNMVYKPKAEQVGDLSVDHVLVDMTNLPQVTDEDRSRIKRMAGQDGLLVRIAAVGDNHVVVLFGGGAKRLAAVAALSAQGQSPLSTDPGIKKVAAKLPTTRSAEAYFSLDNLMQLIKSIGEAIEEPAPFEPTQVGVPAGFVVSGGKAYSRLDLFIPTELMVAVKDLAMQAMGGMTGTPGAPPTMPVPAPTPTF